VEKVVKWIVALGSILFVLALSLYVLPKFACMMLSLLILVALVVLLARALVEGLLKWRKSSNFWPMPALVCLAFILCAYYFASPVGRYISDRMFERHRGDYARVVDNFRDGSLLCASSCNGDVKAIEATSLPAHVRDIWAAHCDGSGVIVLFLLDTDVPLLHHGYVFRDYEEGSDCSKRFGSHEYVRQIEGHWYRFSDQPGF
jgi:hypothetical protein